MPMRKDRVLRPDEMPVIWQFNQQEQQTFVHWAERPDWKRIIAYNRGLRTREQNRIAKQQQFKLFPGMEDL